MLLNQRPCKADTYERFDHMIITESAHSAQSEILSVLSNLAATGNWRLSVAKKHPGDNRNTNAAELLFAISSEPPSSLPDHLIAGLAAAQGIRNVAEERAETWIIAGMIKTNYQRQRAKF
jgi:hypothetical protein